MKSRQAVGVGRRHTEEYALPLIDGNRDQDQDRRPDRDEVLAAPIPGLGAEERFGVRAFEQPPAKQWSAKLVIEGDENVRGLPLGERQPSHQTQMAPVHAGNLMCLLEEPHGEPGSHQQWAARGT